MPHFAEALTILRDRATSQYGKGRSFERLMKTALTRESDIWRHRFAKVWMWDEWPERDGVRYRYRPDRGGTGTADCAPSSAKSLNLCAPYPRVPLTPSWRNPSLPGIPRA